LAELHRQQSLHNQDMLKLDNHMFKLDNHMSSMNQHLLDSLEALKVMNGLLHTLKKKVFSETIFETNSKPF
jgi:hypothetical protein